MVTLEQVKLLESKVAKAIDFVERVTGENSLLQGKLDSYQKRIDELEVLIQQFREDQGRIEDGILSALDRLNQFEDAIEKSIAPVHSAADDKKPAKAAEPKAAAAEPADSSGDDPETPALFSEESEDSLSAAELSLDDPVELSLEESPEEDSEEPAESEETSSGELDIF
jgi:chromosome segregation ATPase